MPSILREAVTNSFDPSIALGDTVDWLLCEPHRWCPVNLGRLWAFLTLIRSFTCPSLTWVTLDLSLPLKTLLPTVGVGVESGYNFFNLNREERIKLARLLNLQVYHCFLGASFFQNFPNTLFLVFLSILRKSLKTPPARLLIYLKLMSNTLKTTPAKVEGSYN